VLPSQRQGKTATLYHAWVVVNKQNGWVLTANCTCMAGLGFVSSMFLHFYSRLKLLYTTSSISQLLALASYVLGGVAKAYQSCPYQGNMFQEREEA